MPGTFMVMSSWTEATTHEMQTFLHKSQVEVIKNWSIPNMVSDLQSFLGFMNYYYHFIKGHAKVTHPLYKQISRDNATQK